MPEKAERLKFSWLKAIWLLVLIALVWWAWRRVPLQELWDVIRHLGPAQLAGLAALNLFILGLFTLRWGLVLSALGRRVSPGALFRYRLAAFGLNYFTPGPQFGGEPLQIILLKQRHDMPLDTAVSGVTLDKILELLANFTFLVVGMLVTLQMGWVPGLVDLQSASLTAGLLLLPLGYLGLVWAGHPPLTILTRRLLLARVSGERWIRVLESVAGVEQQVMHVLRKRPLAVAGALVLSLATWAVMVYEYWLSLHYLGLDLDLPATLVALTAARLAFLMPLPGGLGVLEASQVLVLQALGYGAAYGLSLSLLIRVRDISLGLVGLWLAGALTVKGPRQKPRTTPGQAGRLRRLISKLDWS